jgi:hypothetical protein
LEHEGISEKGKALVVILPEGELITTKGMPFKVAIGEGKSSKILNCQVINRIKCYKGRPEAKVVIENLQIHEWLNNRDRNIFFRKIPNLAVKKEFSFITNTIRKHEMLLRAEETVLSPDPEVENTGDFEPPSDTEVEESEEEPMNSPIPMNSSSDAEKEKDVELPYATGKKTLFKR